jgi:hypothetical protein
MIHHEKFNPKSLPLSPIETPLDYASLAIEHFANLYGWDANELKIDFRRMLNAMHTKDYIRLRRNDPPHVFWSNALTTDEFEWTPSLILFIQTLLVQAHGTQDVERIFSMQRKIDNEFRVNMLIGSIRALLRIRFNGPDLEEFRTKVVDKIASKWIRDGNIKTDDPRKSRGKNRGESKAINRFLQSTFLY